MNRVNALQLLRLALNDQHAEFRDGQWEAIDSVVNQGGKTLVVQRTGWGKSSVYFIATRILRDRGAGITVIVSPLLALMRNQIDSAAGLGIRATTINSTNTAEWEEVTQELLADAHDVLLISPERLANESFIETVFSQLADRIGLLVVDEAHCISDWGHDFRPDYKRLVNVLQQLPPNVAVLGTTATANNRVLDDIRSQFGDIRISRGALTRESIALQTLRLPDQASRLAWLANQIPSLDGTGIVYTLTIRDAEQVARWLQQNGIDAAAYHASVEHPDFENSNAYRLSLEERLLNNDLKVLVATTALGMGYDKPDLAFVIHYQAPGSIVGYYQQVGRAGRAIPRALGILLSGSEDAEIHDYFRRSAFPDEAHVVEVLEALGDSDGMTIRQLEQAINLSQGQIQKVVKYLSVERPAPLVHQDRKWRRTPVAYQLDGEKISRLTAQRELEWQEVQNYIDTNQCLMAFLAEALDDPSVTTCGRCANCLSQPLVDEGFDHQLGVAATTFLKQAEVPLITNKQVAAGAFEVYQFKGNLPADLRAEEGRLLSRWGDAGWGHVVSADKHAGHFSDALVGAAAEMIQQRWRPDPPPGWVTCVPSLVHPTLVQDYAERLASRLGLPFIPAIGKVRENQPQKAQRNRYHRCHNLDGVFAVNNDVPNAPVLLVDDVYDSGWTLTVVSALLRQAGSGDVYPLALADASAG
jgi:ATP-dependent DNA helicase RecQ